MHIETTKFWQLRSCFSSQIDNLKPGVNKVLLTSPEKVFGRKREVYVSRARCVVKDKQLHPIVTLISQACAVSLSACSTVQHLCCHSLAVASVLCSSLIFPSHYSSSLHLPSYSIRLLPASGLEVSSGCSSLFSAVPCFLFLSACALICWPLSHFLSLLFLPFPLSPLLLSAL